MNTTPATPEELQRFDDERSLHERRERRLVWKDLGAMAVVAAVVVIRHFWLS